MTEEQIYKEIIKYKEKQSGTKPYKHDERLIAHELFIRSKYNKCQCKTKIHDNYLRSISYKIGLKLVIATTADISRAAVKKASDQEKHAYECVRNYNRFFLYPVVLKRSYA